MRRRTFLLAGASAFTAAAVGPLFAQDGPKGKILYARKNGDKYLLHVMNADGTGDKELAGQNAVSNVFPTWSPDGKRVAYMAGTALEGQDYKLIISDADGSAAKTIETGDGLAGLPAWSPDGKRLAYTAGTMKPAVFLADADGMSASKFSEEGGGGIFPFFTRDSKHLCYTKFSEQAPVGEIVRKPVAGGAAESFVPTADRLYYSCAGGMSPDGKKLAYVALDMQNQSLSIRIRTLENGSEAFLTEAKIEAKQGPESFSAVSWSPDGKWVYANQPTDKGMAIFRFSDDGQTRVRLTPEGVDCITPAFRGE